MRFSDLWLLWKKIVVGVIVSIVPLAILAGGLWMTQRFASNHTHSNNDSSRQVSYAN
jgi:hypothetical protein